MHLGGGPSGPLRSVWLAAVSLVVVGSSPGGGLDPHERQLKDRHPQVRLQAVLALAKLGDKAAVPAIVPLLKDRDPTVQAAAAEALGALGDKAAVGALTAALEALTEAGETPSRSYYPPEGRDEPPTFGQAVVEALARLEPKAIQPFVAALRSPLMGVRKPALQQLQKRQWRPANDLDRAYYLVAQGKFTDAAGLGTVAIEAIVAPAGDGRAEPRTQAAGALMQIGSKAFDPTVALLTHERPAIRIAAAWVLCQLGDARAVDPLIAAAGDADQRVSAAAVAALGRMEWTPTTPTQKPWRLALSGQYDEAAALGKPAVRPLVMAVVAGEDRGRHQAAQALAKVGGPEAVAAMAAAMKSKDASLRGTAAEALGKMGGPEAVTALIARLTDESEYVRIRAAEGLGRIGQKKAIEPLAKVVKDKEESNAVQVAAAVALADMGDPRGATVLVMATKDQGPESTPAGAALKKLGKAAVPTLIAALDQDSDYHVAPVISYLGKLGDRRAVGPLMGLLPTRGDEGRCTGLVAEALGEIGDPRPAPLLARLMKAERFFPRSYAASALAKMGPTGLGLLAGMLDHEDEEVRKLAGAALKKAGYKPAGKGQDLAYLVSLGRYDEAAKAGAAAVPALLRASGPWTEDPARAALVRIGPPAVEPLIAFLKGTDKTLRSRAIEVLGEIKDKRAAGPLRELLSDKDYWTREAAEKALAKIGPADVTSLAAALKDKDPKKREAAVKTLGKLPGDNTSLLLQALKDEAWTVRYWAAIGLGDHPDPKAIPALMQALNKDREEKVREYASEALGKIGAAAVAPLAKTLRTGDDEARHWAAVALGTTGDKRAIPHLVEALADPYGNVTSSAEAALRMSLRWEPANDVERACALMAVSHYESAFELGEAAVAPGIASLKKHSADSRRRAAVGLGKLGDKRAVVPLIALLKDPVAGVRRAAVEALAKLGDKRAAAPMAALLAERSGALADAAAQGVSALWDRKAYEPVATLLTSGSGAVRLRAIKVLGTSGDRRAVEPLAAVLKGSYRDVQPDWDERAAAAEALGALGDAGAIGPLQAALKDKHQAVRRAAAVALARLQSKK